MKQDYPMFHYPLSAHACGAINGKKYTNSLDALERSYSCGFRFVELDLMLTDDGVVVCSHGFDETNCKRTGMIWQPSFEKMTGQQFLEQTIDGLRTMDAAKLYEFMLAHEDLYIELDCRNLSAEQVQEVMPAFLKAFQNDNAVLDRCLMQTYSEEMFESIEQIYHFSYYMMLITDERIDQIDSIISYCLEHGIGAVSVKHLLLKDENVIRKIKDAGLYLLAYSVDKRKRTGWLLEHGADTVCTNFIDLEYGELKQPKTNDRIYKWSLSHPVDPTKVVIISEELSAKRDYLPKLISHLKEITQPDHIILVTLPSNITEATSDYEGIRILNLHCADAILEIEIAAVVLDLEYEKFLRSWRGQPDSIRIGIRNPEITKPLTGFDEESKDIPGDQMVLEHKYYKKLDLVFAHSSAERRLLRRSFGFQGIIFNLPSGNQEKLLHAIEKLISNKISQKELLSELSPGYQDLLYLKLHRLKRRLIRYWKKKKQKASISLQP